MFKKQTSYIKGTAVYQHVVNPIFMVSMLLLASLSLIIMLIVNNAYATQGDAIAVPTFSCTGVGGTIQYTEAVTESTPSVTITYDVTMASETIVSGASVTLNAGNGFSQSISHPFTVGNGATVTVDLTSRTPTVTSPSSFPIFLTDASQQVLGCTDNTTVNLTCNTSNGNFTASGNANFAGEVIVISTSSVMGSYVFQGNAIASGSAPYSWSFSGSGVDNNWWAEAVNTVGTPFETQFPSSGCGTPVTPSVTITCSAESTTTATLTYTSTSTSYDISASPAVTGFPIIGQNGNGSTNLTGLTPSTTYTFTASNGATGSGTCTTTATPAVTIVCSLETSTTATLTYTSTSTSYDISASPAVTGFPIIGQNGNGSTNLTGLTPSTTYTFTASNGATGSGTCTTTAVTPSIALKKYVTLASNPDSLADELGTYAGVQRDAQTAPGPNIPTGSNMEYVITVANTGDTLIDIGDIANTGAYQVSDDTCDTAVTYQSGNTIVNNPPAAVELLDTTETWIYTCTINNVTAQTTNTASVTGNPVLADGTDIGGEPDVVANDPANVNPQTYGCVDNTAQNYDPAATADDGSCQFADLALRKTSAATNVSPGANVQFTIEVHNQGDVDAHNVEIVDYIPAGMSLASTDTNGWVQSASMATVTIAGPITAGNSQNIDILLQVDIPFTQVDTLVVNYAEIKSAEDVSMNPLLDIDSGADMDDTNDCGGEVNTVNDDRLDGDAIPGATCDEDDHDPESITVVLTPAIDLEKVVGYPDQGERFDADTEPEKVAVATGADATITIYVTNTGNTDLQLNANQPTVDVNCVNLTVFNKGDSDPLDILSIAEVWTYTCVVENVFDPGTCTASVTANPVYPDGTDIASLTDVSDSDPIYLDIGGSLFGATVGLTLEDTGSSAMNFVVLGSAISMGSVILGFGTKGRRKFTDILSSNSNPLALSEANAATETFTQHGSREQQGHDTALEGRGGVLFKV